MPSHRAVTVAATSLLSSTLVCAQPAGVEDGRAERPNIVLIIADDFGVDLIGAYGEGATPPCTPNLDALADEGLLFRNAWTNSTCTPSRAQLLTGRYGFRTGVGSNGEGLALDEVLLPEILVGYSSAASGKWGVSTGYPSTHPNDQGFDHFAGSLRNGIPDYFDWSKTTNGETGRSTTYATTDTADEAIDAARTLPEPWFVYASFNAAHTPTHVPPAELCPEGCGVSFCGSGATGTPELVKGMVEAMDTEIGRLIASVREVDPDAYIVFMGDNGTARGATEAPFPANRAKGTLYEGGVNVPLIVAGPGVAPGAETAGLVSSADLAATLAELAGVTTEAEDSVSMVPYFTDPGASIRETVYAETFSPNHSDPPYEQHDRAVRDERYKLIRRTGFADEFFDLAADPFEAVSIFPSLVPGSPEHGAYLRLDAALVELGVGCVADLDGDGDTDVLDFAELAESFGDTGLPPGSGADLDGDGDVDVADFAIFVTSLGCGLPTEGPGARALRLEAGAASGPEYVAPRPRLARRRGADGSATSPPSARRRASRPTRRRS